VCVWRLLCCHRLPLRLCLRLLFRLNPGLRPRLPLRLCPHLLPSPSSWFSSRLCRLCLWRFCHRRCFFIVIFVVASVFPVRLCHLFVVFAVSKSSSSDSRVSARTFCDILRGWKFHGCADVTTSNVEGCMRLLLLLLIRFDNKTKCCLNLTFRFSFEEFV
jgi:hypothetical protein